MVSFNHGVTKWAIWLGWHIMLSNYRLIHQNHIALWLTVKHTVSPSAVFMHQICTNYSWAIWFCQDNLKRTSEQYPVPSIQAWGQLHNLSLLLSKPNDYYMGKYPHPNDSGIHISVILTCNITIKQFPHGCLKEGHKSIH